MNECIPVVKHNTLKSYWSAELSERKQASVDAHQLWILCDRPRSGLVNKLRLDAKYKYKLAMKQAVLNDSIEFDDEISNRYLHKDMNNFWRKWNNRFSKQNISPAYINGCCKDKDIAEVFCTNFSSVSLDSYKDNSSVIQCLNRLHELVDTEVYEGTFMSCLTCLM